MLLHELGSSAALWCDEATESEEVEKWQVWDGPVYALDFAGHGASDRVAGSGYNPEFFLVDADLALAAIGDRAHLAGAALCPVVWEGWRREAPPYPDLWLLFPLPARGSGRRVDP